MHHPRYCLTHHSGISLSNTNATHFSTPPMPRTSPQDAAHVTHASMSPTQARQPHVNHVNCLTHHPGISSNITKATHFSTPAMPTTLTHRPLYPHWCTTHATHASTSPQHTVHTTHASTSPALARQPRQHATNANTPPTLARLPGKHATHRTHDSTNSTPFLKLLGIQLSF